MAEPLPLIVLLTEREVAALTGLSVFTLQHARCDRPDLNVPRHLPRGEDGRVLYHRAEVAGFIEQRGIRIRR